MAQRLWRDPMKYQLVRNFKSGFSAGLSRDQIKSLLSQRRKNLLHVLMPFGFEDKGDLHFTGGEIVETESEEVTGGNIAEQTDRH
jgi:hypothetical protein